MCGAFWRGSWESRSSAIAWQHHRVARICGTRQLDGDHLLPASRGLERKLRRDLWMGRNLQERLVRVKENGHHELVMVTGCREAGSGEGPAQ